MSISRGYAKNITQNWGALGPSLGGHCLTADKDPPPHVS